MGLSCFWTSSKRGITVVHLGLLKDVCKDWSWTIDRDTISLEQRADLLTFQYNMSPYGFLFSNTIHCMCKYHLFLSALSCGNLSSESKHENADTLVFKSFSKLSSCPIHGGPTENICNSMRIKGNLYLIGVSVI